VVTDGRGAHLRSRVDELLRPPERRVSLLTGERHRLSLEAAPELAFDGLEPGTTDVLLNQGPGRYELVVVTVSK
jgi:hypothetical protein